MVFGSTPRNNLSPQQLLGLANAYLESANRVDDGDIALVLCHDTESSLSQAKKGGKRNKEQSVLDGVATAYIGLGKVLDSRGRSSEAQASYEAAKKMGKSVQDFDRLAQSFDSKNNAHPPQGTMGSNSNVNTVNIPPVVAVTKRKVNRSIALIPPLIFAENVRPHTTFKKLPESDERLINTSQLACCLTLLKIAHSLDDTLEPIARDWLLTVENDPDEQERLKLLKTDIIRAYMRDELKDAKAVAEIVCLSPALDKAAFQDLLHLFYDRVAQSDLLNFHQLDGLANLLQGADPGFLEADDLIKILAFLSKRIQDTDKQSPRHIYQLILAASRVLDAMADTKFEGLNREKLHEPLSSYLNSMKKVSDPYLIYQVAYAYQALQCVPDDESLLQATLRRTGKVIKGVSGLVSAVKGLNLSGFIEGLSDIQKGLAGATEVVQLVVSVFDDVSSLTESGKGFLDCLKEGFSFKRKCAWYTALRGADALIREGEFVSFKKLVCEAPCRLDPAFQWGVCQRLAEIATNPIWDTRTRRNAITFLGEIYRNDEDWGHQASVKEWILNILIQLSSHSEIALQWKAGIQSPDDERFPLVGKLKEFLSSNQKVFLLSGDSGAGKSTFNRHLECDLWESFKKTSGTIPLHINLPAIDKPEQDMIAKQLRKDDFTESEIRELKLHRKFISIRDGYDENQQTHNLYVTNFPNQPGEWNTQMIISHRNENLGVDYRDRFRPGDRNSQSDSSLFQEAVITSFSQDQIQDY
ncbi:hypothetical protein BGZ65_005974, partial [Modicella reniformis]